MRDERLLTFSFDSDGSSIDEYITSLPSNAMVTQIHANAEEVQGEIILQLQRSVRGLWLDIPEAYLTLTKEKPYATKPFSFSLRKGTVLRVTSSVKKFISTISFQVMLNT